MARRSEELIRYLQQPRSMRELCWLMVAAPETVKHHITQTRKSLADAQVPYALVYIPSTETYQVTNDMDLLGAWLGFRRWSMKRQILNFKHAVQLHSPTMKANEWIDELA